MLVMSLSWPVMAGDEASPSPVSAAHLDSKGESIPSCEIPAVHEEEIDFDLEFEDRWIGEGQVGFQLTDGTSRFGGITCSKDGTRFAYY